MAKPAKPTRKSKLMRLAPYVRIEEHRVEHRVVSDMKLFIRFPGGGEPEAVPDDCIEIVDEK